MDKNLPQALTAKDIQKFLNISQAKAYQLFNTVGFPVIVMKGTKRVLREDFLKWVEQQKQPKEETYVNGKS